MDTCSEKLCSNIAVKISERNSVLELEIGPDEFGVRNIRVLYGITHQLSPTIKQQTMQHF